MPRFSSVDGKTANEYRFYGHVYYQGRPCMHGHSGLRYTSNRSCVECHERRAPGYRHAHLTRQIKRLQDQLAGAHLRIQQLEAAHEQ